MHLFARAHFYYRAPSAECAFCISSRFSADCFLLLRFADLFFWACELGTFLLLFSVFHTMDDEQASANAEMRYLTLELMKIAAQRRVKFSDVTREFIENVYALDTLVRSKSARRMHSHDAALSGKASREKPHL